MLRGLRLLTRVLPSLPVRALGWSPAHAGAPIPVFQQIIRIAHQPAFLRAEPGPVRKMAMSRLLCKLWIPAALRRRLTP